MYESELSIVSWNVEGLRSCLDDEDFLNVVQSFDLIFCSETWQRKSDIFELPGYECVDVPRKESMRDNRYKRGHGGICLFIKSKISAGVQIMEKNEKGLIWVKLSKEFLVSNMTSVYVFCIYHRKIRCILEYMNRVFLDAGVRYKELL